MTMTGVFRFPGIGANARVLEVLLHRGVSRSRSSYWTECGGGGVASLYRSRSTPAMAGTHIGRVRIVSVACKINDSQRSKTSLSSIA